MNGLSQYRSRDVDEKQVSDNGRLFLMRSRHELVVDDKFTSRRTAELRRELRDDDMPPPAVPMPTMMSSEVSERKSVGESRTRLCL